MKVGIVDMNCENIYMDNVNIFDELKINCKDCSGFCCVALYFSKMDGFPNDKCAGEPCINLNSDFTCKVHNDLRKKGLKGCTSYDCFGAGQKVCKTTYGGESWIENPKLKEEMFNVFLVMRQLHEMMWYLGMVYNLKEEVELKNAAYELIKETREITLLSPTELLKFDLDKHREKVNFILKRAHNNIASKVSNRSTKKLSKNLIAKNYSKANLRGVDLSGSLLIASNLSNADLTCANLIGADMRDTNIKGANLQNTLFITQMQINEANGDKYTKLPKQIEMPTHWIDKRE